MSQESLPLHKEFGIFLLGWTGAVTITVGLFYLHPPAYHRLPDEVFTAIAHDWGKGMLIGIAALTVFWIGDKIIEEVVNPMIEQIKQVLS